MWSSCPRGTHCPTWEAVQWYQAKSHTEVASTSQSLICIKQVATKWSFAVWSLSPLPHIYIVWGKRVFFTAAGGKYQSQRYHPWKDRAELHLAACGFDVVWAGRRHAQIPVILDTKTVLLCLIVSDTPPCCASPPTRCSCSPLPSGDVTSLQGADSVHKWVCSSRLRAQVIFSGVGGNPAWES